LYKIIVPESFDKQMKKLGIKNIATKLERTVYPQLKENPHFGKNIKKLKGALKGLYRYRIGPVRIIYEVDEQTIIVYLLDIVRRGRAY